LIAVARNKAVDAIRRRINEGYAATAGDAWIRQDLCREVIRLGRLLLELSRAPESLGLLALMLLQDSRRDARVDNNGDMVLLEDQVNVEPPPLATLVGLALIETLGGVAEIVTVADWDAEPPAPVHVSVYLVVAFSADVLFEPLIASLPLQPPDAVPQ